MFGSLSVNIMAKSYSMAHLDKSYSTYLARLTDLEKKYAPDELFMEGDVSLLTKGMRVAVVGSRKASPEGIARAKYLTKKLVEHDIIVVSGLAEGIDTVAHTTAIEMGGRTIAVLGTPLSKAYPAKNKQLLQEIKRDHLAVSQFPEGHRTFQSDFPKRNRTMALISDATVIVEASKKSGTRHQGWEALRLGRMVYILQNVAGNNLLKWPQEMLKYGAQILEKESLSEVLYDIPSFTSEVTEIAF